MAIPTDPSLLVPKNPVLPLVGQMVKVLTKGNYHEKDKGIWTKDMDNYIGKVYRVESINSAEDNRIVLLGGRWFPIDVLGEAYSRQVVVSGDRVLLVGIPSEKILKEAGIEWESRYLNHLIGRTLIISNTQSSTLLTNLGPVQIPTACLKLLEPSQKFQNLCPEVTVREVTSSPKFSFKEESPSGMYRPLDAFNTELISLEKQFESLVPKRS